MGKYILALDQGTTSSRAIVFDKAGDIVGMAQKEFKQIYTGNGWVEHNPYDILSSQTEVMKQAVLNAKINAKDVDCIGIANQRETTVVWEKTTGKPIYNAIVWQCRRTAEYCEKINEKYGEKICEKTGLKVDAYFSASKINWILNHVDGARERAEKGELLFGTVDTFLLWNLTKGKSFYTDYTNASRTMLFDINKLEWDDELLEIFGVPKVMLPEVKPSGYEFGNIDESYFGVSISVRSLVGDQQGALFGQRCFTAGTCKNTYGTGCFLLMNTGDKRIKSKYGLLTTLGASTGKPPFVSEGSVFVGGAAVKWLKDGLHIINDVKESEDLAKSVPDTDGVYVVPAFVGLGAPYWDSEARGVITGITASTTSAHIVRATLEGIAYRVYDVVKAMESDLGTKIEGLRVDGGASANGFLTAFQADLLGVPVIKPKIAETTALGASYLAGLCGGFYKSEEEIAENGKTDVTFLPETDEEEIHNKLDGWKKAVLKATAD